MGEVRCRRHDRTVAKRSVLASTKGKLDEWDGHVNESTKVCYRKLAEHFYCTRLARQTPTPKRIVDVLVAAALEYRPAYWRRLRNALELDQREKGFHEAAERIKGAVNPVTMKGSQLVVKPKQKRVKAVKAVDEQRLMDYFTRAGDFESLAAVVVTRLTGARPAELCSIRVESDLVHIKGAKQSHNGLRGLDRAMVLPDVETQLVAETLKVLQGANIGAVQDRVAAAGRRLWPQRRAVPSLYSWRHQLGSDLKASGLSRQEVAWIMGHQSTESVEQYGNRKTARFGAVLPRAPEGSDFSQVRERHSAGPQASRAAHDSPGVDEEPGVSWDYDDGLPR